MKVIAEGVENAEQQAFLLSQNSDEVQRYYYSRPLKFDQLVNYLIDKKHEH